GEPHRPSGVLLLPYQSVLDGLEEPASTELRVVEGHERREHGRRSDAGIEELLHGLVRGALGAPRRPLLGRQRIGFEVDRDPLLLLALAAVHATFAPAAEELAVRRVLGDLLRGHRRRHPAHPPPPPLTPP